MKRVYTSLLTISMTAALPALAPGQDEKPRVVVVLSIDQFRGDFIDRFSPWFGEGGFARVLDGGFNYSNCAYQHGNTATGPGHAVIGTGTYANRNGITMNNWFNFKTQREEYCTTDFTAWPLTSAGVQRKEQEAVSPLLQQAGVIETSGASSPRPLRAGTTSDNLEVATAGNSKTVNISFKDRAGVLMGGRGADSAIWFDNALGEWVSSDYYGEQLPDWVLALNKTRGGEQWFKKSWELLLPEEEYLKICTVDDYRAESSGSFENRTFPHLLGHKSESPDKAYYDAVACSPFGNEMVVDAAIVAMTEGGVGQDNVPDIMTLGFSANDIIGHTFGPHSWEVMDASMRTDQSLARLLTALDEHVGEGKWSLFISADHGIVDFPEVSQDHGLDAKRVNFREMRATLEDHLREIYGPPQEGKQYVQTLMWPWINLDKTAQVAKHLVTTPMEEIVSKWMLEQESVVYAEPAYDLLASRGQGNMYREVLLNSYYPGRSGDVAFALRPNYLLSSGDTGTNHGSAYYYDRHVVMLAYGAGINHGSTADATEPAQIAPTVARLVGVMPPNMCDSLPLPGALK